MNVRLKQENRVTTSTPPITWKPAANKIIPRREDKGFIELSSSDESFELGENLDGMSDSRRFTRKSGDSPNVSGAKRARSDSLTPRSKKLAIVVADNEEGFGKSITPGQAILATPCSVVPSTSSMGSCKQFWKAGDYEGASGSGDWEITAGGFDHVRVHPKFLHSNATSHKWALGAFAELLDNALDEVRTGATYVNVDMIQNKKDGNRMVLIEDDGGGMSPERMRHCMSLGYSVKSKLTDTIGQYGNGFKTSTMRLGADVIVFSRCSGKDGKRSTQSIGLLSYTFLKSTGKQDIVVPMLDYERKGSEWCPIIRSSYSDWEKNVETIVHWSPYATQEDLLRQFYLMKNHGTKIIIYNLWEDDQGMLELDFDTDPHDIQLRGVNRDEKNIDMASRFPNSKHFLTYKHSLRSYVSILYLRIPSGFRIILRGRDVEHHSIEKDMMQPKKQCYKPKEGPDGIAKNSDLSTLVTIGFVKDAKYHVDVQGFNVYHKNRLIKPFWRIWNAAGSDGRGVIGFLEANFVEPAHDKQGFERTTVLSRLEARLLQLQKNYWRSNCHKIGYAPRQGKKSAGTTKSRESSPDYDTKGSMSSRKKTGVLSLKSSTATSEKFNTSSNVNGRGKGTLKISKAGGYASSDKGGKFGNSSSKSNKREKPQGTRVEEVISSDDDGCDVSPERNVTEFNEKSVELPTPRSSSRTFSQLEQDKNCHSSPEGNVSEHNKKSAELPMHPSGSRILSQLEQENEMLKERLSRKEDFFQVLQEELRVEKELRKRFEDEVETSKEKLEEMQKELDSLIDIFSNENKAHEKEKEDLRNKLEEASKAIEKLVDERIRRR